MRVAYVCSRYPAISHTFVLREVRALRELGAQVDTFTVRRVPSDELLSDVDRSEAASTTAILPAAPAKLLRAHLGLLRRAPARYLATLMGAVRSGPPGLRGRLWQLFYFAEAGIVADACGRRGIRHLHAHFANVGADVARLAAELGAGTWSFTMHGSTEFYDATEHRLGEKVHSAAFVACISDFTRSQMMKLSASADWDKLRTIRCGTDIASFDAPDRVAHGGPTRILFVGRLVHGKGVSLLLDALGDLQGRGTAVELRLVGDGPERGELERRAARLGITDSVDFAGAVGMDAMQAHFAWADVFCLPSFAEGVPIVLMEAMAMRLPVVSSNLMGIPELVDHGVSGLLVAPARVDALADALDQLAHDPDARLAMGSAGRDRVRRDYAIEPAARLLLESLTQTA